MPVIRTKTNYESTALYTASVTFTAKMASDAVAELQNETNWWRVSSDKLPLLIGIFCGGFLVTIVMVAIVIYRCCVLPATNKHVQNYRQNTTSTERRSAVVINPKTRSANSCLVPSPKSACFPWPKEIRMSPYTAWSVASCRSVNSHDYDDPYVNVSDPWTSRLKRSQSNPMDKGSPRVHLTRAKSLQRTTTRPLSHPCDYLHANEDVATRDLSVMPKISEFCPGINVVYASNSVLDGERFDNKSTIFKSRSLPGCTRTTENPFSSHDNLSELYAKVNFSKKRKNRMRNDQAAAIALSKSQSQFLTTNSTELLAEIRGTVIVYDERTAL